MDCRRGRKSRLYLSAKRKRRCNLAEYNKARRAGLQFLTQSTLATESNNVTVDFSNGEGATSNAPDILSNVSPKAECSTALDSQSVLLSESWQEELLVDSPKTELGNDTENLVKYRLVGGTLRLKTDIYPHNFNCQKEAKAYASGRPVKNPSKNDVPSSSSYQPFEVVNCDSIETYEDLDIPEDPQSELEDTLPADSSPDNNTFNITEDIKPAKSPTSEAESNTSKKQKTISEPPSPKKRKFMSQDAKIQQTMDDALSILKASQTKKREELDVYGELIAFKLRQLDERTRDIAINRIDNLLFELKYRSSTSDIPTPSPSSSSTS